MAATDSVNSHAIRMLELPSFLPELKRLLAAGATLELAGQAVGISRSAAHRWIDRYGMDAKRRRRTRISPETKQTIRELRRAGHSIAAVAVLTGVSRDSVTRYQVAPQTFRCRQCGGLNIAAHCRRCEISAQLSTGRM